MMRSIAAATAMIAFLWPRRSEAEVSRPEAGVFHLRRRQGRLDEHGFQPRRALAQAPRALSAGAFVEPWTHAGPGEQMAGRGEGLHIDADLGDHGLGDVVADAGKIVQPLGGAAKGSERSLQPRVELRDRGFDLFDRLQMLTDQEAMMVAQASFQRGGEFLARAGELGMAEFGQPP